MKNFLSNLIRISVITLLVLWIVILFIGNRDTRTDIEKCQSGYTNCDPYPMQELPYNAQYNEDLML